MNETGSQLTYQPADRPPVNFADPRTTLFLAAVALGRAGARSAASKALLIRMPIDRRER